ncbi:MAG: hypothetical protein WBP41_08695, partial [Saprospiraceae bacterium]
PYFSFLFRYSLFFSPYSPLTFCNFPAWDGAEYHDEGCVDPSLSGFKDAVEGGEECVSSVGESLVTSNEKRVTICE